MTEDILREFSRHLAAETDPDERKRIIAKVTMMAMQEAPERAFEPPITQLGEYLDTPIPIPPSLVWPTIVVRGEITVTLGRAGKGKTTMNLNRILKWAAGLPLFDDFSNSDGEVYLNPERPLRTLIIENEGNAGMFHEKMGIKLYNSGDRFTREQVDLIRENVLIWGNGGYSGLKLDNDSDVELVSRGLEKWQPDIVFIEPFRGLWRGEENSSTDMAVVVDNIINMATTYNCGVILSHHERKSGVGEDGEKMSAGRGSTVLEGAAALMENFQSVKGGDFRELSWSKARYKQPPPAVRLEYDPRTDWYWHVSEDDMDVAILELLGPTAQGEEAVTVSAMAEELDEDRAKLRRALKRLEAAGRVKKLSAVSTAHGSTGYRYRLPTNTDENNGGLGF